MEQLYVPRNGPMNVVVFFSGGASSLKAMLADENYGKLYRVSGAYTDKADAKGRQLCRENGIPELFINRAEFYSERGLHSGEWNSREIFYEMLASEIARFSPDVICLSGYMHIVADSLLSEYENRILNVHPADLTILTGPTASRLDASQLHTAEVEKLRTTNELVRKFKGEDAVTDAIVARERSTRSTIHIARREFDEGPIIVQSKPFFVDSGIYYAISHGLTGALDEYASSRQERMKLEGDGPAYLKALEFISNGQIAVNGDRVFLDGKRLPYCGFRLG